MPDAESRQTLVLSLLLALACLMAVWIYEGRSGALNSDLGGDPDEAAHAVTALMIRDYLAEGLGQHPMKFARTYYEHFPRVALGHYPPLYYLVASLPLLVRAEVDVLFGLQALFLAILAVQSWLLLRRFVPGGLALMAALLGCSLPLALKLVQHVMSDVLLAVLCLWAVFAWADYLRSPSIRRALFWGCIAAAAILTKGSGMMLCVLPPLATILTGQWRLIRHLSWWCAALPVAVLGGPWMIYSTGISAEGMTGMTPWQYFKEAMPYYLESMPQAFGWGLTGLMLAGLVFGLREVIRARMISPLAASLLALAAGAVAVLLLVPVGLTTRYLLTLVPAIMLAAAFGVWRLLPGLVGRRRSQAASLALGAAFALTAGLPLKQVNGYAEAVRLAGAPSPSEAEERWLISSDPRGEGAVVAAAAFQSASRAPARLQVYRGGKELASSDWMGRGYQKAVETPEALLKLLDEKRITWIMVDLSVPLEKRRPHDLLLEKTLAGAAPAWKLVKEQPIVRRAGQETGTLLVYQRSSAS